MRSLSDYQNASSTFPESFLELSETANARMASQAYREAFVFAERALSAYETEHGTTESIACADMKRLRHQLMRDHLDQVVGTSWPLLDKMWTPIFKLGNLRDVSWEITADNLSRLSAAVSSEDHRRLRFLNMNITVSADEVLSCLSQFNFSPLRVLNLHFKKDPSVAAYRAFWEKASETARTLDSLTVSMPHHSDAHAEICKSHVRHLETLSFISSDRRCMHDGICDMIVDDPQSSRLRILALIGTSIGDSGLMTLLQNENFDRLQMLILRDGILTNTAADIISASELPQLRKIDVSYNQIDQAGLHKLEQITHIQVTRDFQNCRPEESC